MNQGNLIVFEGPRESGKTSLSKALYADLRGNNHTNKNILWFSFPGRTPGTLGNLVYSLHHHPESYLQQIPTPLALQLLHLSAHVDNIQATLNTALSEGATVILDRFWWSTWVYGKLTKCNLKCLELMLQIEAQVWHPITPTILLLDRAGVNPQEQALYNEIANRDGNEAVKICADGDIRKNLSAVKNALAAKNG
jgi:dTMP kinase